MNSHKKTAIAALPTISAGRVACRYCATTTCNIYLITCIVTFMAIKRYSIYTTVHNITVCPKRGDRNPLPNVYLIQSRELQVLEFLLKRLLGIQLEVIKYMQPCISLQQDFKK